MKTGYTVLRNFIYMIFSNFVTRILSLITVVYLANILGPSNFGKLNWALVFVSYFAVLADFSASITGARDLSANKNNLSELLAKTTGFKIIFGFIAFISCIAFAYFIRRENEDRLLIIISSLTIFSSITFFFSWVFQGMEEMKHLSYSLIIQSLSYVSMIFLIVKKGSQPHLVAFILFLSQLTAVIYQVFSIKKFFMIKNIPNINFSGILETASKTAHITWSHFTTILGQNSPLFVIGLFLSPSSAGFFAASQKISFIVWEVISNFSNVLFPTMSRHFYRESGQLNKIANYAIKLTFVVLTPLLTSIAVLSYSITQFIYGNAYIDSYWTLKILIFMPLFMFLDSLLMNILIISGRQKETSKIKTAVTISAFILSVLSVKKFGVNSVAFIFVFSFLASAILQYIRLNHFLKIDWKNSVLLPVLFSVISSVLIFRIKAYSLTAAFLFALFFYLIMINRYKVFNEEEIQYILENIKKIKSRFINVNFNEQ